MFGVGRREFEGFRGEVFRRFDLHENHVRERHLENQQKAEQLSAEVRSDVSDLYKLLWRGIFGLILVLLTGIGAFLKVALHL